MYKFFLTDFLMYLPISNNQQDFAEKHKHANTKVSK